MYDKGDLDKYQYVKYLPKNAVSNELRQDFEKEEEMMQQQQQMQMGAENIISQLTPEEQMILQQNPQILNELEVMPNGM
jgi:hypothetical protein